MGHTKAPKDRHVHPLTESEIKTTRNGSISVRKSHKTGFSRNGDFDTRLEISNPFQLFFFFLFWCLKHVFGEVMGSFLFPTQPARRGPHRPAPGSLRPSSPTHPQLGSAGARWEEGGGLRDRGGRRPGDGGEAAGRGGGSARPLPSPGARWAELGKAGGRGFRKALSMPRRI